MKRFIVKQELMNTERKTVISEKTVPRLVWQSLWNNASGKTARKELLQRNLVVANTDPAS